MRFFTIELAGMEHVAVAAADGELYLIQQMGHDYDTMNDLIRYISDDELEDIRQTVGNLKRLNRICGYKYDQVKILPPIPVPRQDVICIGVNYREHIGETKHIDDFTDKEATVYFSKRVNRMNGDGGVIPNYSFVDSLDYEVELGVVIRNDTFGATLENAEDAIFGYTIINDVSARNVQREHKQWYLGKSLDGYTPMGPCIVTKDEIEDVHNLTLTTKVNGELRQNSNTCCMMTTVEQAIVELSQGMTLQAGTIIATGTPGGVAMGMKEPKWLKSGDRVECEIIGIGKLTNIVG